MRAALFPGDELWASGWKGGRGEATLKARMASHPNPEVILYGSWFCPFVQRAWIACEEKGIDYKWEEINPYEVDASAAGGYSKKQLALEEKRQRYPEFVSASPKGLVPAVACGVEKLCESGPIVEYLDMKFGEPSLCPSDPYERAVTRIWADYADARIQRPYYRMLVEQSVEARSKAYDDLVAGCKDFGRAMAPLEKGPFFLGDRFTYTDASFAPFFQRILIVGKHYRGIQLPTQDPDIQRLLAWWDACEARDSVAATLVDPDRLIASYSQYAENKATSDYAQGLMTSLSATTRASSALAKSLPKKNLPPTPASSVASVVSAAIPVAVLGFFIGLAFGTLTNKRRP